jgi:biopolymer transport protein ExbD
MAETARTDPDAPVPILNITPLIDVMLVLLVMFIITIPLQTHAVKVALPSPGEALPKTRSDFNTLSVAPSGQFGWNGAPVDLETLRRSLKMTRRMMPEPELHIAADPYARYARVDEMLAVVKRSGVGKIGFVDNERYANFTR